ncbi:MAG: outer membrane protein assembly factor BamD [Pseudomonadota bacterium]|jgi:tol-pal system protein YbgF
MQKISPYVYVGLLLIGSGQAVYASPRIESRAIPPQPGAIIQSEEGSVAVDESLPAGLSEDVLEQISALQKEVQTLRGLVETQEHELQRVEKSQQTLFLHLEKQLSDNRGKSTVSANLPQIKKDKASQDVVEQKEGLEEKSALLQTEKDLIKSAENFLKQKKYSEAEKSYEKYLMSHPTGEFAPSVYYTLGEIYWTEWHAEKSNTLLLEKAIHAFSDVANGFPEHTKAKDALLKIGLVEIEKGNYQTAAQYFKKVVEKYPHSPSAKIAELRLQKLVQDGRIL